MTLDLSAALEAAERKHAQLVAENVRLRKALEEAEAFRQCYLSLPVWGCCHEHDPETVAVAVAREAMEGTDAKREA